ncbi:MAG: sugar phosphate isomerase/epimerase, partial [Clostridia bacterium]|nr:sugar phosphate isomerase/epimerase [Clostridia bacterium]
LYGHTPEQIRDMLNKTGLKPISAHQAMPDTIAEMFGMVATYKAIGCPFIAIPYVDEKYRPGTPDYPQTLKKIEALGKKAAENGLVLMYHNHDFEFVKVDGKYGLDVLYDAIPADLLQTELDTCWVKVAGEDPVAYITKYAGRAPIVHLKDFYKEESATQDEMYELIGIAKKAKQTSAFEFRPVGHGMQRFPGIIDAAEAAGTGWLIVEQDRPSLGLTSMESIDLSRKYLRSLGY